MEINLNSGMKWSNVEGLGMEGQATNGVAAAKMADSKSLSTVDVKASALDVLKGSEPIADVSESELRRDDALGNLVNSAFCLQAPPMPDFSK